MDDQSEPVKPDDTPETSLAPAPLETGIGSNFMPPVKPKHLLGGFLKVVLGIVLVAAIAGGVFWFVTQHKAAKKPTAPTGTSTSTTPKTTAQTTKITGTTKRYDSTNYNLSIDYPADWTVADQASAKLTVSSPALTLKDAASQSFTGRIVLTIQNKQTSVAQFAAGKAIAALESQKIAYTKPTPNQRAQTYVSFVNYSGSTSAIDALYIAGDNGYQAQQSIPQADVVQADPLVSISFLKCADAGCSAAGTPAQIAASSWSDTSLSKPLITMLQSLEIE